MELVRQAPTERLTFPDGSWVELKARLTYAERKHLAGAALVMEPSTGADGKPSFTPRADLAAVELAALRLGVVAWSLPEPLTAENLDLLDEETGTAIKLRLDQLWAQRTDDERKNSSGGGAPLSGAGESPRNSAG